MTIKNVLSAIFTQKRGQSIVCNVLDVHKILTITANG